MRKYTLSIVVALVAGFAGSAGFSSPAVAAEAGFERVVVFGQFRLLKNGSEVKLGEGFFSNVAALRLYRPEDQEDFTGRVEEDGEFAFKLAPGEYYLMSITFKHQGETIEPETNYVINVSPGIEAAYIGTITLETTFGGGYHGMKGSFDRFIVSNECAADCNRRMADLGIAGAPMEVALPQWQEQVALHD